MVNLPPLMEPEDGIREEGKVIPAEEGKGDDDDEREGASKAGAMVENPFFNGLDEEGSKGLLIKREAEDQEAKEEAEELKEREEEERTRKEHEEEERRAKEKREAERKLKEEHEAEQRVEEEAERQAREREVSCLEIQQKRPSVIVAARSRKRAIEDETNNKDAALKLSDDDVSPAVLEKSEKEKREREALGQASLDEARIAWILLGCLQMLSGKPSSEQDKEKETPANGHVATLSTEEVSTKAGFASDKEREDKMVDKSSPKELTNTSIKQEITLDEE